MDSSIYKYKYLKYKKKYIKLNNYGGVINNCNPPKGYKPKLKEFPSPDLETHFNIHDLHGFNATKLSQESLNFLNDFFDILKKIYDKVGKLEDSLERMIVVFPSSFGSSRRKIISDKFQKISENIFYPILKHFLFGLDTENISKYLYAFKLSALNISEDEWYYGENIFHLHLDGKPGDKDLHLSNITNKSTTRFITSIVKDNLGKGATVYLKHNPLKYQLKQKQLHEYLNKYYNEVGLSNGCLRPLYYVDESNIVRAMPGEVSYHTSHPAVPIHAEANPTPNRVAIIMDFNDIRHFKSNKKKIESRDLFDPQIVISAMKQLSTKLGFKLRLKYLLNIINMVPHNKYSLKIKELILRYLYKCEDLNSKNCVSTPNFIKKGNWSYNNCMIDRTGNCKKRIKPFY
jgi:hypothetical protein